MNTGNCGKAEEENPWYVNTTCRYDEDELAQRPPLHHLFSTSKNNYSASGNAKWYLNMNVTGELKKVIEKLNRSEVTEEVVQVYKGSSNCPVMGLFRAGMIRRGTDTGNGPGEVYDIQLAYDKSIYEGYPPGVKEPDIEAYGLVAVKPEPASDECTKMPNEDAHYDRRVPCKAHDYCYDLIRFAVAPDLSENDCDKRFQDLMASDCADRGNTLLNACSNILNLNFLFINWRSNQSWKKVVELISTPESGMAPGVVIIRNVETGRCVDVEGGSKEDGAPLIQNRCEDNGIITQNRQFRFHRDRKINDDGTVGPWHFHIRPEHTLNPDPDIPPEIQPSYCVSVTDDNNVVMRIPPCSTTDPGADPDDNVGALFYLVEENASIDREERYTIRNIDSPNRCLSPVTSGAKARLINRSPCQRDSNLHLWEIREVGCWIKDTPDQPDQEARLISNRLCPREQ